MTAQPLISITRHGDITIHPTGRIDLTSHVARTLDIMPGDVVNIASHETDIVELYLYVSRRASETVGRHSCTCRPAKGHGRYLRLFSKPLATKILEATASPTRITLRVGERTYLAGIGPALPIIIPRPINPTSTHQ